MLEILQIHIFEHRTDKVFQVYLFWNIGLNPDRKFQSHKSPKANIWAFWWEIWFQIYVQSWKCSVTISTHFCHFITKTAKIGNTANNTKYFQAFSAFEFEFFLAIMAQHIPIHPQQKINGAMIHKIIKTHQAKS